MTTILCIPDLHLPFHHPHAFEFLELVAATFKPDKVVNVGDIIDGHANSRFEHDPDGMSAGHELELTSDCIDELAQIFPNMDICVGNHDRRILTAAYKAGIPKKAMKSLEEIYELPAGWKMEDYFIHDGVSYEHGDKYGAGAYSHVKAAQKNMMSTVIGHTHITFGVEYMANRNKLRFAANAGCLVDTHSYAMAYGRSYAGKPILGCMIIRDGLIVVPVPMLVNEHNEWTGEI
jgi:metallophosphoesterase superfamily enzyme